MFKLIFGIIIGFILGGIAASKKNEILEAEVAARTAKAEEDEKNKPDMPAEATPPTQIKMSDTSPLAQTTVKTANKPSDQKAKPIPKYDALRVHLLSLTQDSYEASFEQLREILKFRLPLSARQQKSWWGNETTAKLRHCASWLEAGYIVDHVDIDNEKVTFKKKA